MRASILLSFFVVLSVVMAGCGGKKAEPTPTSTTTGPATTTSPPTTVPGPTTPPPPPAPKEVLNVTMKYQPQNTATGQEEKPFKIDAGYTKFDIRLDVIRSQVCATLQADPGQQIPNATFFPPMAFASLKAKQDLDTVGPVSCDAATGKVVYSKTGSFPAGAGDWKVKLYGTGNVDVRVVIVEKPS